MKRMPVVFAILFAGCTSGSDMDARNKDFFADAQQNAWNYFTTTSTAFDGNIQNLLTPINALANASSGESTITSTIIEGIVTIPSNYSIALGSTSCGTVNDVYLRSFVLEDANASILIAYGKEPPDENTANSSSMKYITNSRNADIAPFGARVRLTATRAIKYGGGVSTIPIVTDFSGATIVSTRNSATYAGATSAFTGVDQYRTRRIEGYVTTVPTYKECGSGTRQFQFDYQNMYKGEICLGTVSVCTAVGCTCTGTKMPFQMSRDFGAGTLTGFDYGNAFSYNFSSGAKVRLTGAVFTPQYNTTFATGGALMLTQKLQVESLP